jgi:transcriptional regulator with XRE-family HTH domain
MMGAAHENTVVLRSRLLLSETRRLRGLSLRDMADRLPCGKSFIQALESGAKTSCSSQLGARIEETLAVPPGLLFAPLKSSLPDKPSARKDVAA